MRHDQFLSEFSAVLFISHPPKRTVENLNLRASFEQNSISVLQTSLNRLIYLNVEEAQNLSKDSYVSLGSFQLLSLLFWCNLHAFGILYIVLEKYSSCLFIENHQKRVSLHYILTERTTYNIKNVTVTDWIFSLSSVVTITTLRKHLN